MNAPKHGLALLLTPHDGDGEEHDGDGGASKEDAARSFFEAGEKKDWAAAAAALASFCDLHGGEEDDGGETEEP